MRRRFCYNWSEDNPGCCADYTEIGSTLLRCEYCTPHDMILWSISTFAGIATTIACFFWSMYARDLIEYWSDAFWAKKEAEEKAKKDAEAAEHGV